MPISTDLKIGFLKPGTGRSHYDEFAAMIPEGINLDMQELGVMQSSLTDFAARADAIINRAVTLTAQSNWQGIIIPGAPVEVQNQGLRDRLSSVLEIPFVTALEAGCSALNAYSARKVLLLTPFDSHMNSLITKHLSEAETGIEFELADLGFSSEQDAIDLNHEIVYEITKKAVAKSSRIDALYFQGAVLSPLQVIDEMEAEFSIPVISSNPAMLWAIVSKLGHEFRIEGKGKLVREWPVFGRR
jgi:maleate cis-trans isomerase